MTLQAKKILFIQTAFIGDVVLATSLVEKWHRFYPECKIDFLLRLGNEGVLVGNPLINEVLIWNKKKNKYLGLLKLISKLRKNKYDMVVNVQRFATSGVIAAFSKAKIIIGFKKNPLSIFFTERYDHVISFKGSKHEIDRNQKLIEKYTDKIAVKPKIYTAKSDKSIVLERLDCNYICIAPCSVWFTKTFPIERWISFINQVPNKFKIYLLGSAKEKKQCEQILNASANKNVANLAGELSITATTALMSAAYFNYVNDSAPLHFCSAVNANVAAIFCSTVPEYGFGPLSDKSIVIECEEELSCRPCGIHGLNECPNKHFNCANKIPIEKLLQILKD